MNKTDIFIIILVVRVRTSETKRNAKNVYVL